MKQLPWIAEPQGLAGCALYWCSSEVCCWWRNGIVMSALAMHAVHVVRCCHWCLLPMMHCCQWSSTWTPRENST